MKKDLAQRVGETINELDIDFSRLTPMGWLVSCVTLGAGGSSAWYASQVVPRQPTGGPALAFGATMIAVTVLTFLVLRWLGDKVGLSSIKSRPLSKGGRD